MGSTRQLALASLGMMSVGLVAWILVKKMWPETGRMPPRTALAS